MTVSLLPGSRAEQGRYRQDQGQSRDVLPGRPSAVGWHQHLIIFHRILLGAFNQLTELGNTTAHLSIRMNTGGAVDPRQDMMPVMKGKDAPKGRALPDALMPSTHSSEAKPVGWGRRSAVCVRVARRRAQLPGPGFPSLLVEDGSSLHGSQMLCFTAQGSGLSRATASPRPHIGPAGWGLGIWTRHVRTPFTADRGHRLPRNTGLAARLQKRQLNQLSSCWLAGWDPRFIILTLSGSGSDLQDTHLSLISCLTSDSPCIVPVHMAPCPQAHTRALHQGTATKPPLGRPQPSWSVYLCHGARGTRLFFIILLGLPGSLKYIQI